MPFLVDDDTGYRFGTIEKHPSSGTREHAVAATPFSRHIDDPLKAVPNRTDSGLSQMMRIYDDGRDAASFVRHSDPSPIRRADRRGWATTGVRGQKNRR